VVWAPALSTDFGRRHYAPEMRLVAARGSDVSCVVGPRTTLSKGCLSPEQQRGRSNCVCYPRGAARRRQNTAGTERKLKGAPHSPDGATPRCSSFPKRSSDADAMANASRKRASRQSAGDGSSGDRGPV